MGCFSLLQQFLPLTVEASRLGAAIADRLRSCFHARFHEEAHARYPVSKLLERQKQILHILNFRSKSLLLFLAAVQLVCAFAFSPLRVRAEQPVPSETAGAQTSPLSSPTASPTTSKNTASDTVSRSGVINRSGSVDRSGVVDRGGPVGQPSRGVHITRTAQQYKGWPYVWGGTSPKSGFDCSGLVQYVYAKWGIYLPRCASEQVNKGVPVKRDDLQAGDLVFFKNTYKQGLSHVGIYVGKGWFIHAASARTGVIMSRLDKGYHKEHWYGARRLNLSKLPPVEGEELQSSHVILEAPAIGDPLPSPEDIDPTVSTR